MSDNNEKPKTIKVECDVAGVPPLLQGDRRFTRTALADVPGIGIEFKEYYTGDYYKAICHWSNKEAGSRVYEVTARKTGCKDWWLAEALTGGRLLFTLEGPSKCMVIEYALAAMRRYLVRSHRCAWRTYRNALKASKLAAASAGKAAEPLTPEEELADTVRRQRDEEVQS